MEREQLNKVEVDAFNEYLTALEQDDDGDDKSLIRTVKENIREIWRGPAFCKRTEILSDIQHS